jgi:hypothetical protein
LLKSWQEIAANAASANLLVHALDVGEKLTNKEIKEREKSLNYTLPPSYKNFLINVGGHVSFYYSFSDTTMPDEFRDIFSGGLNLDIALLESANEIYDESLKGKLIFSHSGNEDLYLFDMEYPGEDKPVLYWEHEGGLTTLLAHSFAEYLEAMTALKCIGDEIWQFKYFIDNDGINPNSVIAKKWQALFNDITTIKLNDVQDNLDRLIDFAIIHNISTDESFKVFEKFGKDDILDKFAKALEAEKDREKQKVIANLIGRILGTYAANWTLTKWEENAIDSEVLSTLALKALSEDKSLSLVLNYLENKYGSKLDGVYAWRHLRYFRSNKIIPWMESKAKFPLIGWDYLLLEAVPDWEDIQRWAKLQPQHEAALVQGLKYFIERYETERIPKPMNLPSKKEFFKFLITLKEKQVLTTKAKIVQRTIDNIDAFY